MYQTTTDQFSGIDRTDEKYNEYFKSSADKFEPTEADTYPTPYFVSKIHFERVQEQQKIRQFIGPQFGLVALKKGNVLPEEVIKTFLSRAQKANKEAEWIMGQIGKYTKGEANDVETFLKKTVKKIRVSVKNYGKGENVLTVRKIPLKNVDGILYSDRTCVMKFEPSWCRVGHKMSVIAKQFLKHHFGLDIDSKPIDKSFHAFINQSLRNRLTQIKREKKEEIEKLHHRHQYSLRAAKNRLLGNLNICFKQKKDFQFRFQFFVQTNAVGAKKVYKKEQFATLKKYYNFKRTIMYERDTNVEPVVMNTFDYNALHGVWEKNVDICENYIRRERQKIEKSLKLERQSREQEEEERKKKKEEKKKRKEQKRMDDKFLDLMSKFQVLYNVGVYSEEDIDAFNTRLQSKIDKYDKKRKRAAEEERKEVEAQKEKEAQLKKKRKVVVVPKKKTGGPTINMF